MAALALFAVGTLVVRETPELRRGGLHPCDRLTRRVCSDLGADDCSRWRTHFSGSGTGSTQPHRWSGNRATIIDYAQHKLLGWDAKHEDNPLCYRQLADDLYPQVVQGIRSLLQVDARRAPVGGP